MSDNDQQPEQGRRRRHTAKEHGPDPIDIYVGNQLRVARELAGLTQTEIGRSLGMSFQVIQKYEQGEIRISASRLFQLAVLLGKPLDHFFVGFGDDVAADSGLDRRHIELIRAFRLIQSAELRQALLRMMHDVAELSALGAAAPKQAIEGK
jgi:transcriptional regulator with XRE-family HTH domain